MNTCKYIVNQITNPVYRTKYCIVLFFSMQHFGKLGVNLNGPVVKVLDWVLCSKPLGGSKVDSALYPSEVDKISTRNFWGLSAIK